MLCTHVCKADDYLINFADQKQLSRLRKIDLIRLYNSAGLTDDPETLTKQEIVCAIIDAREDYASIPPSSIAGKSSDYSSDDGNTAGDEATDAGGMDALDAPALNLRRRATIHELSKSGNATRQGRSYSMGTFPAQSGDTKSRHPKKVNSSGSAESRSVAFSYHITSDRLWF